jgi:hypothetical protein
MNYRVAANVGGAKPNSFALVNQISCHQRNCNPWLAKNLARPCKNRPVQNPLAHEKKLVLRHEAIKQARKNRRDAIAKPA